MGSSRRNYRYSIACRSRLHSSLTCAQEFREIHAAWKQWKDKEKQRDVGEAQNLPTATTEIQIPPSTSQNIETSVFNDLESLTESYISITTGNASSPTLCISTISDLTPTDLGEDIEHSSEERTATRHDTFYFEDGNVEIMCGDAIFKVHSPVVSFSSPMLRDILSQPALLRAPTPGGCPRVTISDGAEDFAILLKMIYTPGYIQPLFSLGRVN